MVLDGPMHKNDYTYYQGIEAHKQKDLLLEIEGAFTVSNAIDETKKRDPRQEYNIIHNLSMCKGNVDRLVQDHQFQHLNRYSDIMVYDDTRVKLKPRVDESKCTLADTYINACFVDVSISHVWLIILILQSPFAVGDQKIIASQGPLDNTVADFWRMISQENVQMIVTTCRLKEGNRPKCEQFWPNSENDEVFKKRLRWGDHMTVKPVKVENLTSHLQKRTFTLTDTFTDRKDMPITQLHYSGWPDHGVPSGDTMDSFRIMLDEFMSYQLTQHNAKSDAKSIVHCSAGVGRTGTTIALAQLITHLWAQKNAGVKDPKYSVFSTVRRLRYFRFYLVQSVEQYIFIYDFMAWYLKHAKFI